MKFLSFIVILITAIYSEAQNLVINGDFSNSSQVESDLSYSKSGIYPGKYTITNNAESQNNTFVNPPGSQGNFMIADMDEDSGNRIWRTKIQVEANKSYSFSFMAANIAVNFEIPSKLRMTVNGTNIGQIFSLPYRSNDWIVCTATYRSGGSKEIEIAIENLVRISNGNDLAIDNVSFVEVEEKVYTMPPPPPVKKDTNIILVATVTYKPDTMEKKPEVKVVSVAPVKKDSVPQKEIKPVAAVKKTTPVMKNKPLVPVKKTPVVQKTKTSPPVKKPTPKAVVKENKPKPKPIVVPPKPKPAPKKKTPKSPVVAVAKPVSEEKKPIPPVVKKDTIKIVPPENKKIKTSAEAFSKPPVAGEKIQMGQVYFEQSKTVLLPSSYPELDNLVKYLNHYPTVRIRLEGHTDTQGDPKDNLALSEQRVQFLKKYIVEKGINENRVEWIGYGSSKPLNSNRIETLRKLNRRVEVVFLSK